MRMKIQPFLGCCRRRFQRRVLPEGDIGHFLAWWFGIRRSAVTRSFFLFFFFASFSKSKNRKKESCKLWRRWFGRCKDGARVETG